MDKLKVGILGLGRGFTYLRNFLALENAEVVGACDRWPERRERGEQQVAESGSTARIVPEFDDLLDTRPDAIMVASNGKLQVQHACQALEAGCHVLSEVPGAYTEEEWVLLRDAVDRTGRAYTLAENSSFLDFLRYWRKWILEGRFGHISIAEAEYLHYLPATVETPDRRRISPSQAREEGIQDATPVWRADQPPIQYLTHDLGPLLEVLDDRVVSVSCRSAPWRCPEAPLRSDGQIALFHTRNGNLIKIMVTLNTRRPEEHRYRLFGTEGSTEWFSYEKFCKRFSRGEETREGWEAIPIGAAALGDDTTTGHGGVDLKVARAFTNALLEGRPVPIDIYRSMDYSLPGIIANRSAEMGGQPLAIPDLRRESFGTTGFWDVVGLPEKDPPGKRLKDIMGDV